MMEVLPQTEINGFTISPDCQKIPGVKKTIHKQEKV